MKLISLLLFRKKVAISLACLLSLSFYNGTVAYAHSPLFDCFDNGDETVTCEGGFSDGASAQGVAVRALNAQGKVLYQSELDENNSVSFDRPVEEFSVVFYAGKGHEISVYGDDII